LHQVKGISPFSLDYPKGIKEKVRMREVKINFNLSLSSCISPAGEGILLLNFRI
jgi:hypothetical protein